jgi:hypothetical protein
MAHQSSDFRQSPADEEKYKFDPFTHSVTVISEQHRMSHDGFMHHSSGKVTGMVDTNVDEFLIDVPAATFPHLQSLLLLPLMGHLRPRSTRTGTTATHQDWCSTSLQPSPATVH